MRLLAGPALLALAGLALADVTFTEKTNETRTFILKPNESKRVRTMAVAIKGRQIKFAETDAETGKVVLIDIFDAEKCLQIDASPENKTFAEVNKAALDKRVEQATKRVENFEAKMGPLPPERKALLEKYVFLTKKVLGLLKEPPKVEMSKTGEKQKIGAFDCERVVIKEANEKGEMVTVFDCWMTEQLQGWSSYLDFFTAYKAFSPAVLEKMKELKGLHVKGTFTPYYFDGDAYTEQNEFDNSDAKEGEVKPEEFTIPADYKNPTKK